MSLGKERVVVVDRAAYTDDDLPVPNFDCNWSEYPDTPAEDLVPRLFWATTVITHDCSLGAEALAQLHKLKRVLVTGSASVDAGVCAAQGISVLHAPDASPDKLIALLEAQVAEA